jgi:hypothetical protein
MRAPTDPLRITAASLRDRRQLECWLVFACTEHVAEIDAARPLLQRDETLQQAWLERRRRALNGRRWERPKPLATGADAKDVARAGAGLGG